MEQKEERNWGVLVHLAGIVGAIFSSLVGNILGALIAWLWKRNESPFLDQQGKEALNFQITLSIASFLVGIIFSLFWSFRFFHWGHHPGNTFGFFLPMWYGMRWHAVRKIFFLINLVFSIIGAIKANKGEAYHYPISLRLVK